MDEILEEEEEIEKFVEDEEEIDEDILEEEEEKSDLKYMKFQVVLYTIPEMSGY